MARRNSSSSAPSTSPPPRSPRITNKARSQNNNTTTTPKIHEGCLAIHKPHGITSAQVIRDLQTHFNPSTTFASLLCANRTAFNRESPYQKGRRRNVKRPNQVKIGHGGTLDPLATGVLILGIGKGTKELGRFLECKKRYETVVLFGAATDTYDTEGRVVGRKGYGHVTRERVGKALGGFRGRYLQSPPAYSAKSVNGKRLYEYAREGLEVPKVRDCEVEVSELEMVEWLEGGSHGYRWPEKEADKEAKVVAEKVMGLDGNTGLANDENSSDLKRKRDDGGEDAVPVKSEVKRAKNSEDLENQGEPMMSGALQPDTVPESEKEPSANEPKDEAEADPDKTQAEQSEPRPPAARIRMTVTSGFYVRSFCHDLGAAVDSLALMSELVRSQQHDFSLGKGLLEYSDLEKGEDHWGPKVQEMLAEWNTKYDSTRKARQKSPP